MCNPGAVGGFAGVAEGLNFYQQREAAQAQISYGRGQFRTNKDEAIKAMVQSFQGGQRRIGQERTSTAQAMAELSRQAAEARGSIKASSSTVSGNSIDALLSDFDRQEAIRAEVLSQNLDNTTTEITQGFEVIRSNAESRIRSGIPAPVQVPSFLNAAIQIGSSALNAYGASGGFASPPKPA
jgi:hypothetical protein